eukprot:150553_1
MKASSHLNELMGALLFYVTIQSMLIVQIQAQKNCERAFQMFSETKQTISGQMDNGIEYHQKSKSNKHFEWFIDKYGTCAKYTLFESCQSVIDYAMHHFGDTKQYYRKYKNPFQLKIRNIGHTYCIYIKMNFNSNSANNWFDLIRYYSDDQIITYFIGKPPLKSAIRNKTMVNIATNNSVQFERDIVHKRNWQISENNRIKMNKIMQSFNISTLRTLEKLDIISRNNSMNTYYPPFNTPHNPTDAVYIALNDPIPSNCNINSTMIIYHAIPSAKYLFTSLMNGFDYNYDYYMYGTLNYGLLQKCFQTRFNPIVMDKEPQLYSFAFKIAACRRNCIRRDVIINQTKLYEANLEEMYEIICHLNYIQLRGIIVKAYVDI